VTAVRASDVLQFELSSGDFAVRIRREPGGPWPTPAGAAAADAQGEAHLYRVLAPLTGVFYRAPTPTGRPYVEAGEWVEAEAVIGLIETMKIYNEVTTDRSGRVVRFVVDNGALVHSGESLVLIEPGERSPAEAEPATGLPT
jgi:acetyl-CoA carboxylase biotin carboxyl carrier protein